MKYQVDWNDDAAADLAQLWIDATDRGLISEAAHRLDLALAESPLALGESRLGHIRIAFSAPLGIEFEVDESNHTVLVIAVWSFHS